MSSSNAVVDTRLPTAISRRRRHEIDIVFLESCEYDSGPLLSPQHSADQAATQQTSQTSLVFGLLFGTTPMLTAEAEISPLPKQIL